MIAKDTSDITKAAQIIQSGGLVAFPTETVYGLGANALNTLAVAKIFEAKKRPLFDPLIVHIANTLSLKELIQETPPAAKKLIHHFWPGPLTIIFKKTKIVPDLVTAGFDTVAIRMPNHPIALELIKESRCPIAAPSANPFGKLSPTQANHVKKHLNDAVDMILDGGRCQRGLESTIIDITQDPPRILRSGALAIEDIKKIIKNVHLEDLTETKISPGSLPTHYAPQTKLVLLKESEPFPKPKAGAGYLVFGPLEPMLEKSTNVQLLSTSEDLTEAAANFFDSLHELDNQNLKVIYVKPFKKTGLGAAMMDRLVKAANTFQGVHKHP